MKAACFVRAAVGPPRRKIDHVDRAGRDDLGNATTARRLEPARPGGDDRAGMMIGEFLQAEIHDGGKGALGGERFEGPPAHAGRVEHCDFIAARL